MRIHPAFIAMAAMLVCCCQQKEQETTVPQAKTFYASIEGDYDTKTSLGNGGNVLWKQGDMVSVFDGSTINKQYQVSDASDGKTSATLDAVAGSSYAAGTEIDNNAAFYPYAAGNAIAKNGSTYEISCTLPATQNYAAGSFGNGAFPMVAVTSSKSDRNLVFRNALGALTIQLKGTATISSISITGNNNEILCGAATVTTSSADTPVIALSNASAKTVTLDCGSGVTLNTTTATAFTIALPPITMTGGFTVTVTDTQSKQMQISTSKSQTITRSNRLVMPEKVYSGIPVYVSVDLGLSVKWATFNLGATAPEEYGMYYQWGDTQGYGSDTSDGKYFYWSNYKWCDGNASPVRLTKYNCVSSWGSCDGKIYVNQTDDAARAEIGDNWRLPTRDEWTELLNTGNCSWTWTTINGVNGYKVQSKKAGYTDKWIFLPAAGHRTQDNKVQVGEIGGYWSSSLDTAYPNGAISCSLFSSNPGTVSSSRYEGQSVRAVYVEDPKSISLNKTSTNIEVGAYETLTTSVRNSSGSVNSPVEWSSSNTSVATVDGSGKVTAVACGNAIITAKTVFGALSATCNVLVTLPQPQKVDLGLSVKWASFNLGATAPEEYGFYYQWGDTKGYGTDTSDGKYFGWSDYKWCNGSADSITKYNNDSDYGSVDYMTSLVLSDDAARASLGGSWRMPTRDEWTELKSTSNCSWTETRYNGVVGYKVQSKKAGFTDKWIFLPAAGIRSQGSRSGVGSMGAYWSSSLGNYGADGAFYVYFQGGSVNTGEGYRNKGISVRPVSN